MTKIGTTASTGLGAFLRHQQLEMNQMSKTNVTTTSPTITPITSIDAKPMIENGNSPTAIILAITILISILVGSITGLVRVVIIAILRQTKLPR